MNVSGIFTGGADVSTTLHAINDTRIVLNDLLSNESYLISVAASRNSLNLRGDFSTPILVLPCKFALLLTFSSCSLHRFSTVIFAYKLRL